MKVSLEKSEQHVTHVQLGRAGISSGSPAHGRNSGTFSESLDWLVWWRCGCSSLGATARAPRCTK